MRIYFDGCSWTKGEELVHPEQERFSKLICDELGAEETNLSIKGGSNDRIVRNLLVENNIEDYDLAVIQMTFPVRTEFFNKHWVRVNPKNNFVKWLHGENGDIRRLGEKFKYHADFWKYWYTDVSNQKYFETKEKIHYHTIRNSCKIPLVLCTINRWTELPFDLQLNDGTRNMRHERGHPNKHLHKKFAEIILGMIKNL
tara:strand:- start:313 stop:909 length:597 start_codon:yes stop_codon:yes gene_type:complete